MPREMLRRLTIEKGDKLYAIETKDGYLITHYDPAIADQLEAGREFIKEDGDTVKPLVK